MDKFLVAILFTITLDMKHLKMKVTSKKQNVLTDVCPKIHLNWLKTKPIFSIESLSFGSQKYSNEPFPGFLLGSDKIKQLATICYKTPE